MNGFNISSISSGGIFGNFPNTNVQDSSNFLFSFPYDFVGFAVMVLGNFLLSQPLLGIFASSGRQV